MYDVRPKKSLGQHFLTDQNIAQRIVEQLSPDVESVIEVGAGTGVLTQYLVQSVLDKFHVIEIDKESIAYLEKHFPMLGERLIEGDFLRTDLSQFGKQNMAIIGNFPYNISSQIFFQVLKYKEQVVEVVGMVQKEMAERMAAKEGSKTYGILSVLMQAWYDIEYLFTVTSESEIRRDKNAAQRRHRLGLRRKTVCEHREAGLQPAPQDHAQLATPAAQARNHRKRGLQQTARATFGTGVY